MISKSLDSLEAIEARISDDLCELPAIRSRIATGRYVGFVKLGNIESFSALGSSTKLISKS